MLLDWERSGQAGSKYVPSTAYSNTVDWCDVGQVTIDILPDNTLLEIFDFYVAQASHVFIYRETWITLVHVCRKWREIVFESPRRLNLRLVVVHHRSVRVMLDTWPPLLIDLWGSAIGRDTTISALEHNDRIRLINLDDISNVKMTQILAAMQKPFPALISLRLSSSRQGTLLVVPDLFLESTPHLQSLQLINVPFPLPALKKLLLSTTDLIEICIQRMPNSLYISPDEMVTCLSTLIRLKKLELGFQSRRNWGSRRLPPSTRCVLPALTSLQFKGVYEYMEDFMARIDAPQLDELKLFLFDQPVLDAPQLVQFIGRVPQLRFKALNELHILFDDRGVFFFLPWSLRKGLQLGVFLHPSNQLSGLVKLCTSSFLRTIVPIVKHLYILDTGTPFLHWLDIARSSQWMDLLRPFTTVEDLYLSQKCSTYIAPALCGSVGEGMTEVLPALRIIFLERLSSPDSRRQPPVEETIRQFVAARQLSSYYIAISYWDGKCGPWFNIADTF